jgi:hypothetical protein
MADNHPPKIVYEIHRIWDRNGNASLKRQASMRGGNGRARSRLTNHAAKNLTK